MKTAKIFKNGQSQAVRLPKEFRLPGREVNVRKIGQAVVLLPSKGGWESLIESLELFSADFMSDRRQPKPDVRTEIAFE